LLKFPDAAQNGAFAWLSAFKCCRVVVFLASAADFGDIGEKRNGKPMSLKRSNRKLKLPMLVRKQPIGSKTVAARIHP
jgi:hypothetical protein